MGSFIYIVTAIFQILVFMLTLYYLIISFFGLYKRNEKIEYKPEKSFALVVAAHNEELVVGQIVESLKSLDYPKELYDIYVVADNCTDNTAAIARESGAIVFERFNRRKSGKGYALEWMFNKLFKMDKKYDVIAVFDADNLVSKNFLNEMNYKFQQGYKVVQGYLDSKNPSDSWITQCYSIAFWSSNRLFQISRQNLGLSNQLGGTGFCVDAELLKSIGWGATCLTEDLEFTCKIVLNGEKVGWAHNAVVYDEKPLTLKQSWNQRKRWMQGYSDVATRYFFKLIAKSLKERNFAAFDCALYILQPFVFAALGLSILLSYLKGDGKLSANIFVMSSLFTPALWKSYGIFQFLFTPFVMVLEKKLKKRLLLVFGLYSANVFVLDIISRMQIDRKLFIIIQISYLLFCIILAGILNGRKSMKEFIWYLLYGLYTLTWIPISIQGIINKNNREWSHTLHTRQIKIRDLEGF